MKHVAVIGLGIMGHGIADNFLKAGDKLTVWNRTPEKAAGLVARGATLAETPAAACKDADMVFEVTANDQSSQEVWTGKDGILEAASGKQYLFTCATLSVGWVEELGRTCADKGLVFFDAPMTGGRVAAESGQLTLLIGGDEAKLGEARPGLEAIARDVKFFGSVGAGTKYKLILNTLQAIHLAGFGEAMRLAKAAGLDEEQVANSLAERPGGVMTEISRKSYGHQPEPITFSVQWIAKDLGYTADMAGALAHPLLDDVSKLYQAAMREGHKDADWTSINES